MTSLPTSLNDAVAAGQEAVSVNAALLVKLTDMAGDLAINLSIAAIILFGTVVAAKWAARLTRRGLLRVRGFRHDQTVLSFAVQVVRVVVYIVGFIAVLQRLGVQTTSIIAVLGAASLAVGLALQGTLSNVAAGVLLLVLRPYKVGDVIDIGGVAGSVQRLDLFTTQMSNANNHKIVVPNSKVLGDVILNLSGQKTRRVEINFTVGYGEDLNAARAVLVGVAEAHEKVLDDPAPWTGVTGLLDSAVQITLQAWVNSEDWWQTQADLMQGGKEAIDAAGIEIPFPHQVAVPYGDEDVMPVVTVRTAEQKARRPDKSGGAEGEG
ncbi:MAG: mechanosensitive ion channel family protein [Pseudomonadota bacterium]|nr:mechanosensitive ion channel family protein [Pseudomonadota bacterium]